MAAHPAPLVRLARWAGLPGALVVLLGLRLLLQIGVYQSGFRALTADDFGRVIAAARWALHPHGIWQGPWLPLYTYGLGALLQVVWDLYWLPRALAAACGLASLVLVALLTARLYQRRLAGLLAALLLALNPAHVWLSSVPLTEITFFALIAGAALAIVLWAQTARRHWLALGVGLLALASGVRVEGWLFSAVLGAALAAAGLWHLWRGDRPAAWPRLAAAATLAVVPLAWLASNWAATRDPFYFLNVTRGFDQQWYGAVQTYQPYLQVLVRLDPVAALLLPLALAAGLVFARRHPPLRWYLLLAVGPFALYALFQRGQVQPLGNYIRYLSIFFWLTYPLLAGLLLWPLSLRPHLRPYLATTLVLGLALATVQQVRTAHQYENDPAAAGLAVGRWLRADGLDPSGPTVLLELNYWQYLAVHTGANDLEHILYDRPLDFAQMGGAPSLLLGRPDLLRACVAAHPLRHLVVASPELRTLVETTLGVTPVAEVSGYALYRLTAPPPAAPAGVQCPLPLGTGY